MDVHFYMTYYLAHEVGLSKYTTPYRGISEDLLIAWGDQYIDDDPYTNPVPSLPFGVEKAVDTERRRKYHFRSLPGAKVVAGSPIAAGPVNAVLAGGPSADPLLFGMALHPFQDSWSHEGFNALQGHMWTRHGGHTPDCPSLSAESVDKAMKMAEETYHMLIRYRQHKHPGDSSPIPSFSKLAPGIRAVFQNPGKKYVGIDPRVNDWKNYIRRQLGGSGVWYGSKPSTDPMVPGFNKLKSNNIFEIDPFVQ